MIDRSRADSARCSLPPDARLRPGWLLGLALATGGCSMIDGGVPLTTGDAKVVTPATPMGDRSSPVAGPKPGSPASGIDRGVSPADLMFQSTEPFVPSANSVDVFGELDGLGPSIFAVGGRAGFQQHTFVDEGYDAEPDVSPDGRWLLFSSTRHSEHTDLYLQRVDGTAVTQLTTDPADDAFPRFSRDGKQIAFASNRSGNWDVYVMDVEGKNVQQVTRALAQELHPSFSPDGNRIVFCAMGGRSGQWELWTVDLRNLERRMIGYGLFPEWSPRTDRDIIAFQRARQRGTHWFSAWTLELVDDDAKNLTEIAYSTNAAVVAPAWSPDGKRLTFGTITDPQSVNAPTRTPARKATTQQDVWTVNADGTDRRRLTDGRGVNASPSWGSDGQVYFVSDRGGSESIWSVAAGRPRGDATARTPALPDAPDRSPTAAVTPGER